MEIPQDDFVGLACKLDVALGDRLLEVEEEEVHQRQQRVESPPACEARSLDAAMETLFTGGGEQRHREFDLREGLSAGNRYPASRGCVESLVWRTSFITSPTVILRPTTSSARASQNSVHRPQARQRSRL